MDLHSGTTDDSFTSGSKEDEPGNCPPAGPHGGSCWELTHSPVTPKDDILDIYRAFEHETGHDAFLYLALTRAHGVGDTFLSFELNQHDGPNPDGTWTNASGSHIPCRETGDLLITFEIHGATRTVHIDEWVTTPATAVDPTTGCALAGTLQPVTLTPDTHCPWSTPMQCDVQGALNSVAIVNYLPGQLENGSSRPVFPAANSSIPTGEFGEVAINLTQVLHDMGEPCSGGNFVSTWAHSRASESETSAMKDYVAPQPFEVHVCPLHPRLRSTWGPPTHSSSVPLGTPISDTAILTGGDNPTGTMTFRLYRPGDSTCSRRPIFTSDVPVDANGRADSGPFTPRRAGTYRWTVEYDGDANDLPAGPTRCGASSEKVTVNRAAPELTTEASGTTVFPNPIHDTATVTGGSAPPARPPTGTVTFKVFSPSDTTCSTPVHTFAPVDLTNGTATSPDFVPTEAGTWRWVAEYSGDRNNESDATSCNESGETSVVDPPTAPPTGKPTITTTATPSGPAGSPIMDTANLTGGTNPTGTITFYVYGPDDSTCSGTPAAPPSTATVMGGGVYSSAPFTPTDPGTYRWVAHYSGDANNDPAATSCNESGETSVVSKATPAITTSASPTTAPYGSAVGDTAMLTGGADPRGTITFRLYGPNDASCSGTPAFVVEQEVIANGSYPSPTPTPTLAGAYRWVATYSGDARNNTVSTRCGDPGESVVVESPPPIRPSPEEPTPKPKPKPKPKAKHRTKPRPPAFTG
jgi:hypothetical protein